MSHLRRIWRRNWSGRCTAPPDQGDGPDRGHFHSPVGKDVGDLLDETAESYEHIVALNGMLQYQHADCEEASNDNIAESLLDWAITGTKAREAEDCVPVYWPTWSA